MMDGVFQLRSHSDSLPFHLHPTWLVHGPASDLDWQVVKTSRTDFQSPLLPPPTADILSNAAWMLTVHLLFFTEQVSLGHLSLGSSSAHFVETSMNTLKY